MEMLTTLLEAALLIALVGGWMVFFALIGFQRLMSYASASAAAPAAIAFIHSVFLVLGLPTAPEATAAASIILPVAAIVIAQRRSDASRQTVMATVVAVGVPALLAVTVASRLVRFERATPDTLLYLAHARLLHNNSSLFLESADLAERGLGVSSYHSLAVLFDNDLFAAMQLNIGVASCAMIFATSRYLIARIHSGRVATLAATFGTVFIASTDRFVFSHQLVGQHGLVGLQLGATVMLAVSLHAVPERLRGIAIVGIALIAASVATARPEGVLSVTYLLFLLTISGLISLGDRTSDLPPLVVGLLIFTFPWAAVLWLQGARGQAAGTLMISCALFVANPLRRQLSRFDEIERTPRRRLVTRSLLAFYFAGLFGACLLDPGRDLGLLTRSIGAIVTNLMTSGGWGLTMILFGLLIAVPDNYLNNLQRLLKDAILGSAALLLGLAVVRGGEYRVGPGDSFNRILFHYMPVSGVLIALAVASILSAPSTEQRAAAREQ